MLASATPAEGKTVAVPAPTPSNMARPGGVPSLEQLRELFPELEILSLLGAGGMGAVYKARQPRLNRLIALKIMVAPPGNEADFALRFEREAQVLARLSHSHIVVLHDFGELGPERTGADPLFYFLMEYVDGTDLGQLIRAKELMPAQALAIVPQICEALQYAHDQGITHRDIKPANILIDKRGVVKVADFGLAKVIGSAEDAMMTGLTQTGTAMGTPHYMAPEQWEHPEQVDHRADIYALGVVFYEMLTGERPAGVFEPPSKKSTPPVDKKLDSVVMRAMDKNPDRRYQHAGQIGDDVTRISGANKRRPATSATPRSQSPFSKHLLALGTLALLGLGGWWVQKREPKKEPAPAVIPQASFSWGKSRYAFVNENLPWPEARKRAEASGGRLAIFESEAEELAVRDHYRAVLNKEGYWIGGYAEEGSQLIRWITQEAVGKVSWGTGHPGWRSDPASEQMQREGPLCAAALAINEVKDGSNGWINIHPQNKGRLGFMIEWDEATSPDNLLIGGSSPEAAVIPGHLRAAGTTANGQPHDLSKFAAHDDFIDVAGGWGRWVALRANGDTVSSDGKTDLRGIRRIARSFNAEYGFIDSQGKLRLRPDSGIVLPAVLDADQVVDAALGVDHGLALLSDQTVAALGPRYEGPVGNPDDPKGYGTPRWPPPPDAALRQVHAVAVTVTHAATLRTDGTLSIWGWEGEVKWTVDPRQKRLHQLRTSEDAFWALDEAGQLWRLHVPRNPSPDQPVYITGKPTLVETGVTQLGENCWFQEKGLWTSDTNSRGISDLLRESKIAQDTAFSTNIGTFSGKPFASLLWIEPNSKPASVSNSTATQDAPFINSLGMKFLPVPITGGPTDGKQVLFSIWETRVQDFELFDRSEKVAWFREAGLTGYPTHPVMKVTWTEAQAFCVWLTERERKAGTLAAHERYRLPTDHEWSCAVGIGIREDAAIVPEKKRLGLPGVYPWGSTWPPPERAGNYASEELRPLLAGGRHSYIQEVITGYMDGHSETSPVGFYPPNALGLHDLGGNVLEWCEDWFDTEQSGRVNRGSGAWSDYLPENLLSAHRGVMQPEGKVSAVGFRIVRVGEAGEATE